MPKSISVIGPVQPDVDQELIDALESLLAQARSGELRSLVASAQFTGREVLTLVAGDVEPFVTLGALEFAKARVLARIDG